MGSSGWVADICLLEIHLPQRASYTNFKELLPKMIIANKNNNKKRC